MTAPSPRSAIGQLREARRRLLDDGEPGPTRLAPTLLQSWQRSQAFGLVPDARTLGIPHASSAQLARALEQQQALLSHARPVMQFMAEQIRDTASMVILADSRGMLLHSLGDDHFVQRASRVALRPGATWHEQWRGTNAIGTALEVRAPVTIHGAEHYLERNAFLTCSASPIVAPAGQLLGVIDISGDHRGFHPHTLGLVRSAARMIEHQLFETRHGGSLRLHLHAQVEGLGTVVEGLLALSEDGWIIGANTAGLEMLGLRAADIGAVTIERALALELRTLLEGNGHRTPLPRQLRLGDGRVFWVRVGTPRGLVQERTRAEAQVIDRSGGLAPLRSRHGPDAARADALAALDTGDPMMQSVIGQARRVVDKPIALLVLGESGVGKELFARACHDSGARRDKPFVAVNCAALPETLIEAELFGYRPGAFTGAAREGAPGRIREADGGTLFLDEIGDMPLAMQARLLRVLQEREVVPLGGGRPVRVDFQLICATHRRLRDDIAAGRFREDLYYRLNGLTLPLPPLRERSDLAALVAVTLERIAPDRALRLAPDVAAAFARYRWPGNLRQLANVLGTACALADGAVLGWGDLPADLLAELAEAESSESGRSQSGPPEAESSEFGSSEPRSSEPGSAAPLRAGAAASRADRLRAASRGESVDDRLDPNSPSLGDDRGDDVASDGGIGDLRGQTGRCILEAVRHCNGNLSAAARRLGISRNTLYRHLRGLGTPARQDRLDAPAAEGCQARDH
jgi:transcriptional regulator of acetoin/glycerol metabolism